jgi:hypothetical protein
MIRYKKVKYDRKNQRIVTWHKTKGTFNNWTRGGPLNMVYAAVTLRASVMFIPRHDIHPEDLKNLPAYVPEPAPAESKEAEPPCNSDGTTT